MIKRICIFSGSCCGARDAYSVAARAMGMALVRKGIGLVYGGGGVGLMGIVADTVLSIGGEVIGIIPQVLATKEFAHQGLTDLRVVGSMNERKAVMAELADAFVALPGGYGTLEELCEVLTMVQLGFHKKPCGLFNVEGFYDSLLKLFNHAVTESFIHPDDRLLILEHREPDYLLDMIIGHQTRISA